MHVTFFKDFPASSPLSRDTKQSFVGPRGKGARHPKTGKTNTKDSLVILSPSCLSRLCCWAVGVSTAVQDETLIIFKGVISCANLDVGSQIRFVISAGLKVSLAGPRAELVLGLSPHRQ